MYGYAAEEVTGKHFFILIPEERRAEWAGIEARLLRGDALAHFEREDMRKDGSRLQVSLTLSPIKDAAGVVTGVSVMARDITERKRAEAEHTRLIMAIEQSAEAVVITNPTGDIEYVNPAFTRITGYSREEVLGQNPRVLKSGKQDSAFYQQLWETILEGRIWRGELINRRRDGTLYTEQMGITPVRGALGRVTHFIATKQDVTERKGLEEQVRQSAKMEAIGRLAGGVAHDFNNLLTIINGYSELLLEKFGADRQASGFLYEVKGAGERAASLTRQLLAFSRRQVLAPQVLDLNTVVSKLEKMLKRLIGEDVNLRTVPPIRR
jgi:PAS domain S-box-containing protein